jgi:hypothetical protein
MGSMDSSSLYAGKTGKTAWILAISQPTAQFPRHPTVDGLHSIDKEEVRDA